MDDELNIDSGFAKPGSTRYMDAPALRGGLVMPAKVKLIIAGLGCLALLVATIFGARFYDTVANAPARYNESITEAIRTGPGLQLPVLNNFAGTDVETIKTSFADSGYTIIDVNELYDNDEEVDEYSLDLLKIPADMDKDLAESLFKKSLRRAAVLDAAHYLGGSWRFTASLAEGCDLKVKYADLESATIEDAIARAISNQGWTDSTMGESGVDQSGNTFQSGTITVNEVTYNWTVSACPLDEVYSVNGLPDNSFYVGARLVS